MQMYFLLSIAGKPPVDSVTVVIQPQFVSTTLYAAMSAWAVVGMVMTLVFLAFNVHHRNNSCVFII